MDLAFVSREMKKLYEQIIVPAGDPLSITFEVGRMIRCHGYLVSKVLHGGEIQGLRRPGASMADLMRRRYGAYHHITVLGEIRKCMTASMMSPARSVKTTTSSRSTGIFRRSRWRCTRCDPRCRGARTRWGSTTTKLRGAEYLLKKDGTIG